MGAQVKKKARSFSFTNEEYDDGPSFWRFVRAAGLPHVRLNSRRIMFDPQQLEDWLARRTVGKAAS